MAGPVRSTYGVIIVQLNPSLVSTRPETSPATERLAAADHQLLHKVAELCVRRGLGVPAVLMLEMCKPLNYVGSQALAFAGPFVQAFVSAEKYYRLAELLEDRKNVEVLLREIELALETQAARRRGASPRSQ